MPRSSHSWNGLREVGKTSTRAPACPNTRSSMSRCKLGLYQRWYSRCIGLGRSQAIGQSTVVPAAARSGQEFGEQSPLALLGRQFLRVPLDGDDVVAVGSFDAFD